MCGGDRQRVVGPEEIINVIITMKNDEINTLTFGSHKVSFVIVLHAM